jgi:heme/copper-type cytochrome/quinol oxidase subunit 3
MTEVLAPRPPLPVGSIETHAFGWWGMIGAILTEASLFGYLLFTYFYFTVQTHTGPWPPEMPELKLALPNTIVLLLSSGAVWWGERATRRGARLQQTLGLAVGFVLGVIFVGIQVMEWRSKSFSFNSDAYGSLFFTVTGFHMAHVIAGLLILLPLTVWSAMGYFGRVRSAPISIGAIYWHFVDVVWLVVFFTLYLTPYLGLRYGL